MNKVESIAEGFRLLLETITSEKWLINQDLISLGEAAAKDGIDYVKEVDDNFWELLL